ncbi:hypothetical protein A6A29_37615 [Streptomyces sp. TSRI0281]|nr:hypothetical protein A6A29_37615 [Streptomyces sp. TSRI0281]
MLVEHLLRGRESVDPLAWAVRFLFGFGDQHLLAEGAEPLLPDRRHAPLDMLTDYIDRLETHTIRRIVISSPTFTQYRHRGELLDHISAYAHRAAAIGETVTTIIGSIRAGSPSPTARATSWIGPLCLTILTFYGCPHRLNPSTRVSSWVMCGLNGRRRSGR